MPVFSLQCRKYVTSTLSHCEWIDFYCLQWWNKQQFSQCFCWTLTWTTRHSVFWRHAAETSSVGVVRNLFLSLHGSGGRFWCPQYILLFLLPSSRSQYTVLWACQQHNAADLFSPPPCSRYGWGAGGLPWQPLLRGNGGSDLRGKDLCGGNRKQMCTVQKLQSAQPHKNTGSRIKWWLNGDKDTVTDGGITCWLNDENALQD